MLKYNWQTEEGDADIVGEGAAAGSKAGTEETTASCSFPASEVRM